MPGRRWPQLHDVFLQRVRVASEGARPKPAQDYPVRIDDDALVLPRRPRLLRINADRVTHSTRNVVRTGDV